MLATRGLLNRFEVEQAQNTFPGPNMMSRIMEELILYGGTPQVASVLALLPAAERPHYGTLDLTGDPRDLPTLGYYGPYRLQLKKKVVERSTFTPGSIPTINPGEVYAWSTIEGALTKQVYTGDGPSYLFEQITTEPTEHNKYARFIEGQILGGVDLVTDVERLYYPRADRFTHLARKIRRLEKECEIEAVPY